MYQTDMRAEYLTFHKKIQISTFKMQCEFECYVYEAVYQKQMSRLPALLGDLHECALFDKHLPNKTTHSGGKKTASEKLFWSPKILRSTLFKIQASSHLCFDSVTVNREQKRMHRAHPSGLQEIPLALHAVLNVDQTQQVLLE